MLKNNKGFSLIELFAMILITTIIIYPLMQSLVSNIKMNSLLQDRRSATSISSSSLYSLDKMDFLYIYNQVQSDGDYFIDLNLDTCNTLVSTEDRSLCTTLFTTIWNNLELTSDEYKIIIYDYYLPQAYINALTSDPDVPIAVQDEIALIIADEVSTSTTLLRITIWIEYQQDPSSTMTLSGLIYDE